MSTYKLIPETGIIRKDGKVRIFVENIKCGSCANTITKSLSKLNLMGILVDHENSIIEMLDPNNDQVLLSALNSLHDLGYPVIDTEEGITKLALKTKSYASCAIGKIS